MEGWLFPPQQRARDLAGAESWWSLLLSPAPPHSIPLLIKANNQWGDASPLGGEQEKKKKTQDGNRLGAGGCFDHGEQKQ